MNELNPVHDRLFRQIMIGEGTQNGIKMEIAEKYLKKNGDYSLEDFIKTVNERYSGKFLLVTNNDRIICLAINPKLNEVGEIRILKERSLAILCIIFIFQCKTGVPIKESELYTKLGKYLSPNQIKINLSELRRDGYLESLQDKSEKDAQILLSQMGLHMLPQTMLEDAITELFKNPDFAKKLKEILPMNYLKIQASMQTTLDSLKQDPK